MEFTFALGVNEPFEGHLAQNVVPTLHLGGDGDHQYGAHLQIYDQSFTGESGTSLRRPPRRRSALQTSPTRNTSVNCVICRDTFLSRFCFPAPCGHFFCPECMVGMAEAAVAEGNADLFPLRCCDKPLPLKKVLRSFPEPLRTVVAAKSAEMSVPLPQRLYCPNGTCSAFLGRSSGRKNIVSCPKCHAEVCSACKRISHSPEPCKTEELPHAVKELLLAKGWKICPGCTVIVERLRGCRHMKCRCGTDFCYDCGKRSARCQCFRAQRLQALRPVTLEPHPFSFAIGPASQPAVSPTGVAPNFPTTQFIQASTTGDLNASAPFSLEYSGINFEQDFREWFNPDDLDMR